MVRESSGHPGEAGHTSIALMISARVHVRSGDTFSVSSGVAIGDNNKIYGSLSVVRGNRNTIVASCDEVHGNYNVVHGSLQLVNGEHNKVVGHCERVIGDNNISAGRAPGYVRVSTAPCARDATVHNTVLREMLISSAAPSPRTAAAVRPRSVIRRPRRPPPLVFAPPPTTQLPEGDVADAAADPGDPQQHTCSICFVNKVSVFLTCGHATFCMTCIREQLRRQNIADVSRNTGNRQLLCPTCRQPVPRVFRMYPS
jgi:hypothetical protein